VISNPELFALPVICNFSIHPPWVFAGLDF